MAQTSPSASSYMVFCFALALLTSQIITTIEATTNSNRLEESNQRESTLPLTSDYVTGEQQQQQQQQPHSSMDFHSIASSLYGQHLGLASLMAPAKQQQPQDHQHSRFLDGNGNSNNRGRSDRILLALSKFITEQPQQLEQPEMGARIQTRSAPLPNDQEISRWFDAFKYAGKAGAIQTPRNTEQSSPSEASQQELARLGPIMSSGHKTTRNIQPVFMRLPPRFGKRTCLAR